MANETPITTETVALTEKKMDMSLDAIIKMSKSNTNVNNKGKKQRVSNKKESFNGSAKNNTVKVQRYMNSRSDVRQGAFAKRRSNFQGNQFPVTTAVAHKAASATTPLRGRPFNAGRMTNTNQSRFMTPQAQNRPGHGGFVAKQQQQRKKIGQKQANGGGGGQRQQPQTLDSRFANMKEERLRMKRFTDNVGNNGVGLQQRPTVPWARRATRFPN